MNLQVDNRHGNIDTGPPKDPTFLRLSAGFVYFYFGFLKLFPDLSPAELLASQTLMRLSLHGLDADTALWWLAVVECGIGVCFLFNVGFQYMFPFFLIHQAGTFLPLIILPEFTFKIAPFAPTFEGQYICKNLISVAAGWTVMLPIVKYKWRETFRRVRAWREARTAAPVTPSRPAGGNGELRPDSAPAYAAASVDQASASVALDDAGKVG